MEEIGSHSEVSNYACHPYALFDPAQSHVQTCFVLITGRFDVDTMRQTERKTVL